MTALSRAMPSQTYPDDETVLFANRINKTYPNQTKALEDVKLRIQKGEFVSLLGPSGCGKSTLLRIFAGLETASAGHVTWWNQSQMPINAPDRVFSMVFQEANLLPWQNVLNNVRLPLDLTGMPKADGNERAASALEAVGLSHAVRSLPRELSGGMRMRVAIARALVTQPNLLLMDEPFGALDEFTRNRLDDDLLKLWTQRDLTVVFVTHSIQEAVLLSSRIVVMGANPGRVIAELTLERPPMEPEAYRASADFHGYCTQITDLLRAAHGQETH